METERNRLHFLFPQSRGHPLTRVSKQRVQGNALQDHGEVWNTVEKKGLSFTNSPQGNKIVKIKSSTEVLRHTPSVTQHDLERTPVLTLDFRQAQLIRQAQMEALVTDSTQSIQ